MRDDIEAALRGVIDPELNADIVELGMVSGINILHFTVQRDGTVHDLTILGSDAHACLDRTSVRAIELSLPFMPLPDDFPEDVLEVTAQFSYTIN